MNAAIGQIEKLAVGRLGSIYITNTSANSTTGSDKWGVIQALSDTVIASLTSSTMTGTLTAIPLPAGAAIYGYFTSITLTSGKVVAYVA